jgi:hypothetical protein
VTKGWSVEDAVRDRFGYSFEAKQTYEETVQVEINPRACVRVLLRWKNLLETGLILLKNQGGNTVALPFSIIVGIAFDQAQVED